MGRAFYLLVVIWLVGLAVCVEEALRWADEEEALGLDWDLRPEDERGEPEDFIARRDAGRMAAVWTTGAVAWGAAGAAVLWWLRPGERLE